MSEKVATEDKLNGKTAEAANNQPKRARRGVTNETRSTNQLKFHERDASQYGLFVGHLEEVLIDWRTLKDDVKGLPSFAGLAIPRLIFHFTSNHSVESDKRHVYQTFLPIESNVDTIIGGQNEWQVNNLFGWIKHILTIYYLKNRKFTDEEEDALSLPFFDTDEEGQYLAVDPEEVIKGYQVVFENVVAMMNGSYNIAEGETAKPCYREATGKAYTAWLKLLRFQKRKGDWKPVGQNGELAFPAFLGEGCIELVKAPNIPPTIHLNVINESITPKEVKKAPNIGAPGIPSFNGAPNMGGIPSGIPSFDGTGEMAGFNPNTTFDSPKDDLPF